MNKRPIILTIAGVLAAGAGVAAYDYLTGVSHQPAAPERPVLVATQLIHARDPISPTSVHVELRPGDAIEAGALTPGSRLAGKIAMNDIPTGAAITTVNSGSPETFVMPVRLRRGMRAMSIPVDEVKDISGLLNPGDHVDVIAVPPRTTSEQPHAYTILRNIIVLAVGGQVNSSNGASPAPGGVATRSVTLQVTPQQADLLAVADLNSTLRLALRTPDETTRTEPSEALVFPTQQGPLSPVSPTAQAAAPGEDKRAGGPPPAPASTPAPVHRSDDGVEYILGDQVGGSSK
ncbi:MAG: Flp pilus assembly protein CpaB [Candidatus Eremiobacteraeota bacterium]|nr:Flp pilus assembly protein CpaB [Candidatus Eremiobacteraeota bacterium]